MAVGLAAVGVVVTLDVAGASEAADTLQASATGSHGSPFGGLIPRLKRALGRMFEQTAPRERITWAPPGNREVLTPVPPFGAPDIPPGRNRAHAYQYVSRVFRSPSENPKAIGYVRRGVALPVGGRVHGPGCKKGIWFALKGAPGVLCSRDGFAVSASPIPAAVRQPPPDLNAALPYQYAKAVDGALRFLEIPDENEVEKIAVAPDAGDDELPPVVQQRMEGVFLLALDREEGDYYRTVRGRFVRKADVELKPEPGMRGQLLGRGGGAGRDLPLAFVYGEQDAPLYKWVGSERVVVGAAKKHARFRLDRLADWEGTQVAVGPDGLAVPRDRVRLSRRIERPESVAPDDKWIHVDLDEQTLVAYEGDRAVFTTLVSSGKGEAFATPTGLYQVREKHISTTMNGPDPDEGFYEVEEVPWTMYYQDSFALHGAYWHDTFGNTRSHGCTNLSPVDARWLFYWTDHPVPAGWNALRKLKGTWVYLTRRE